MQTTLNEARRALGFATIGEGGSEFVLPVDGQSILAQIAREGGGTFPMSALRMNLSRARDLLTEQAIDGLREIIADLESDGTKDRIAENAAGRA